VARPRADLRTRAAIALALLLCAPATRAAFVSDKITLSEPGCRFPDVAAGNDRFLVVWADYTQRRICGRFVAISNAAPLAPVFCISSPTATTALFPAVAYAPELDEFLVTWDDEGRGDVIHGQRIKRDGTFVGTNFAIGTVAGTIRSAVAWCGRWLVVYAAPVAGFDVHGRFVDATGTPGAMVELGVEPAFAGYPSVTCGTDRFLVTWDHDDGNIRARTVDAKSGALGAVRTVTTGGAKDRSQTAFDAFRNRFVVAHNEQGNAGFSYDQYGVLVTLDGSPLRSFPLAHTAAFEGDTQFGGDLTVLPTAQRMVSSFGTDMGMALQEADTDGNLLGPQMVIGTGNYTSLSNAGDDKTAHVITAWEGVEPPDTQHRVFVRLYETSRAPTPVMDAAPTVDAGADSGSVDSTIAADGGDPPAAPLEGCACRATPRRVAWWPMLVLLLAQVARRRARNVG
jgi:hypothetical protein